MATIKCFGDEFQKAHKINDNMDIEAVQHIYY